MQLPLSHPHHSNLLTYGCGDRFIYTWAILEVPPPPSTEDQREEEEVYAEHTPHVSSTPSDHALRQSDWRLGGPSNSSLDERALENAVPNVVQEWQ